MQTQPTPLRRSKSLAILSHEHHEILLFVWKIRQGMIYQVPSSIIGRYCAWFWEHMLRQHFEKEEMLFSGLIPETDLLLMNLKEDHELIRRKMQEVIEDPWYFQIQRLAQIIYHHIRFEERTWFPHVERVLNDKELTDIGNVLSTFRVKKDLMWQNEFWKKTA